MPRGMEIDMFKNRRMGQVALAAVLAVAVTAVQAAAGPYDAITEAVDFSDVNGVVAIIAGGLALAFVFIKGAKLGLALLRG